MFQLEAILSVYNGPIGPASQASVKGLNRSIPVSMPLPYDAKWMKDWNVIDLFFHFISIYVNVFNNIN